MIRKNATTRNQQAKTKQFILSIDSISREAEKVIRKMIIIIIVT